MKMIKRFLTTAILAASTAAAAAAERPVRTGPPAGTRFGELADRLLALQNHERLLVGHLPLVWDPALAAAAAAYGPTLVSLHHLVHSPRESRPGQRENLAMGPHGISPEQMVGMWTAEKRLVLPGIYPAVSRTGNWMDVSHYTQMIWPTTTRAGCALVQADYDYLICRYSPPGNIDGRPLFVRARPMPAPAPLPVRR